MQKIVRSMKYGLMFLTSLCLIALSFPPNVEAAEVTTDWYYAETFTANSTITDGLNATDGDDDTFATVGPDTSGIFGYWQYAIPDLPEDAEITSLELRLVTQDSFGQVGCTEITGFYNDALTDGFSVSSFSSVDVGSFNETIYSVSASSNNDIFSSGLFNLDDPHTWRVSRAVGGCTLTVGYRDFHEAWVRYTYDQPDANFIVSAINSVKDFISDLFMPDPALLDQILDNSTGLMDSKVPFAYMSEIADLDWSTSVSTRSALAISWPVGNLTTIEGELPSSIAQPIYQFFQAMFWFGLIIYIVVRVRKIV